jgi:hypothetical protein
MSLRKRYNDNNLSTHRDIISLKGNKQMIANPSFERFIPNEISVSLYYAELQDFTATASHSQVYRGNDVYDPDYSGTGAQPLGFDEFMAIYSNFRVDRSECEISVTSNLADVATLCTLTPALTTGAFSSQVGATCLPYAKWELAGGVNGQNRARIKSSITTAKVFGLPQKVVDVNPNFWGDSSNYPAKVWYWRIQLGTANGTSTNACDLMCRIRYDVTFFSRKTLSLS